MSNIMSLKSIKNKPHRDGFDLSRKFAFSAKLGELLPVFVEDVFPGDKFNISADWFTRSQPVTSPAFTRFGEYYDFFFVPYHLLWRYFPQFIIQTNDDNWATGIQSNSTKFTQHPYISSKELLNTIKQSCDYESGGSTVEIGSVRVDINDQAYSYGALKLLEYLGYGKTLAKNFNSSALGSVYAVQPSAASTANAGDTALNPFPLAAYQKVYQDFYRNSQWEAPQPYSYNFDYLNNTSLKVPLPQTYSGNETFYKNGLLTMRYSNFNKDYFLGRLPEKQYGTEALAAPLINSVDGNIVKEGLVWNSDKSINVGFLTDWPKSPIDMEATSITPNFYDRTYGIGALAIRQAEFLQKWKEITQSGGTDYVSQIQKHFGVTPSKEMAHRCTYIGGFDNKFGIDEVVNTNLSASDYEANIQGKGVNAGHGSLNFDVKEHGIIIGIYHMSLLPEYLASMTDKLMTKTMPTDYVIPEMDNVGMQSVLAREFCGYLMPFTSQNADKMNTILGYVPRYAEYKTKVDRVGGAFSNTLYNWVTPLNRFSARDMQLGLPSFIDDSFFYKINPKILDGVFAVSCDSTSDTDQFLINCGFNVKAVRNISRDGLPY